MRCVDRVAGWRLRRVGAWVGATLVLGLLAACGDGGNDTMAGPVGGAAATTSTPMGAAGAGAQAGASVGGFGGAGAGSGAGGAGTGGAGGSAGGEAPWSGPLESLAELDLGTVTVGELDHFPIPDRTLGFTVLAEAPSPADVVGIYQLRPPTGSSVIFNFAMTGHDLQVFGDQGWCSAADPMSDSSDAVPVKEGSWAIRLGSDGSLTEANLRIWARRTTDGAFHGGVVDVNVLIAPGTVSQSYVSSVLANHLFPYAGLGLGTVAFFALDAASTNIDSYDEYAALLASSAGTGTEPALNLFVVGHFGGDLAGALGVAGGIPGSPMQHGTTRSGLAYTPTGNEGYDGTILAHEMGHVAGLFHTTELELEETDPLSDTLECPFPTIASNPNQCPDRTNLMFPVAYGGTELSSAQSRVIEGSALYRGVLAAGGQPEPPLPVAGPPASRARLERDDVSTARGGVVVHSSRLPGDDLERLLSAHWCVRTGDPSAIALRLAGPRPSVRLGRLVDDVTLSDVARSRALRLAARVAAGEPVERSRLVARAVEAVRRVTSGRMLRLEAIDLLERAAPGELAAAAADVSAGVDVLVDARLARLGLR